VRRFWWTVWIEVAIVAFLLYMGYDFARDKVQEYLTPYLIEEEEVGERSENIVSQIVEKVEERFGIRMNYEDMIFDYANEFALTLMEQSEEERKPATAPNVIVETEEEQDPQH
jgi:hypothetical protein